MVKQAPDSSNNEKKVPMIIGGGGFGAFFGAILPFATYRLSRLDNGLAGKLTYYILSPVSFCLIGILIGYYLTRKNIFEIPELVNNIALRFTKDTLGTSSFSMQYMCDNSHPPTIEGFRDCLDWSYRYNNQILKDSFSGEESYNHFKIMLQEVFESVIDIISFNQLPKVSQQEFITRIVGDLQRCLNNICSWNKNSLCSQYNKYLLTQKVIKEQVVKAYDDFMPLVFKKEVHSKLISSFLKLDEPCPGTIEDERIIDDAVSSISKYL